MRGRVWGADGDGERNLVLVEWWKEAGISGPEGQRNLAGGNAPGEWTVFWFPPRRGGGTVVHCSPAPLWGAPTITGFNRGRCPRLSSPHPFGMLASDNDFTHKPCHRKQQRTYVRLTIACGSLTSAYLSHYKQQLTCKPLKTNKVSLLKGKVSLLQGKVSHLQGKVGLLQGKVGRCLGNAERLQGEAERG